MGFYEYKKRTECHKKPVRKVWIEDIVVNETMQMLNNDAAIDAIVSMLMAIQDQDNVNIPILENELRETNIGIQNMLNAIQQGILTKSTKEPPGSAGSRERRSGEKDCLREA